MNTKIILWVVLIIAICVGGGVYAAKKAHEIPADISTWNSLDTTEKDNTLLFELQGLANPRMYLATPQGYAWQFTPTKAFVACKKPTPKQPLCLETTALTLSIRKPVSNTPKRYFPGYEIEFTSATATSTFETLITKVDAMYEKDAEKIESKKRIWWNDKEAYEIVFKRSQAESEKQYIYYTMHNGAEIRVSTYVKPIPDFLKTISFK